MIKEGSFRHRISIKGIKVDKTKVEVIKKLPLTISIKGVRSFLGNAGFYERFIKDFSKIVHSLCNFLEKELMFVFDEACFKTFEGLKQKLILVPIIVAPDKSQPFRIKCDASGVVLCGYWVSGKRKLYILYTMPVKL